MAKSDGRSFYKWLEGHPLKTLASVAATVATLSSGVVTYFWSQRSEIQREQLKLDWNRKYEELASRLVAIERRVGDELSYFDTSRLMLSNEQVRALPKDYQPVGSGQLFVRLPQGNDWNYQLISELDLLTEVLGNATAAAAAASSLPDMVKIKNVHQWKKNRSIEVRLADPGLGSMTWAPQVRVQSIPIADYEQQIGGMARKMEVESSSVKEIDLLLKKIGTDVNADSKTASPGAEGASEERTAAAVSLEQQMRGMMRDDLALFMVNGIIVSFSEHARLFQDARFRIASLQKKGNVLYVRAELDVPKATVRIDGATDTEQRDVFFERELFIVGAGTHLVMAVVELPSVDRRPPEGIWTSEWLAGLRIPMER